MAVHANIAGVMIAAAALAAPNVTIAAVNDSFATPPSHIFAAKQTLMYEKSTESAKRGRGRGRGGDDDRGRDKDRSDNNDYPNNRGDSRSLNDNSPSGRSRPRIPGGSGCDDPGDIAEHPECRV